MQSLSKRKIRDEDDAGDERKLKAGCQPSDGGRTDESGRLGADFSIPRLRFATESWAGMKTTNEDRHSASTHFFPGSVFGVLNTVASAIRQHTGKKALASRRACRELSSQEMPRQDAIIEQRNLLRQQLTEVEALRSETTDPELEMLFSHLTRAISQMESEVEQIDTEEAARHETRWKWCQEQHDNFFKAFKDAFKRVDAQI